MRTSTTLAAGLLLIVAFSGAAGGTGGPALSMDPTSVSPGPFAGALLPRETATHHYQNAPEGANCIAIVQAYTVAVESTGPVLVSVGTRTVLVDGVGALGFLSGVCTQFDIGVSNVGDLPAAYAIEVFGGPAGSVAGFDDLIVVSGP